MKLLLIRHGESRGNLDRRWQGWLDEPLTERGRGQARLLAERLSRWSTERSMPIMAVYSSTLSRAYQTAGILARRWGVPLVLDGRLRERNIGELEGLTWPEVEARHPQVVQALRERWVVPTLDGGESIFNLADRVWQATQEILERSRGSDDDWIGASVAVVSHGGTLNAFFNRLTGRDDEMPFLFRLGNASLSVVEFQNGRPHVLLVNDRCHLEG